MRLVFRKKTAVRTKARLKNKARVRKKVTGTADRPRMTVYRSGRHMYAQVVDDVTGHTLVSASTLKSGGNSKSSIKGAQEIGQKVAEALKAKKIDKVVFDRSGYVYHGRVQAVADAAREAGLKF